MPHPGSPRKNGKDLPFDYGKGIQKAMLSYFHNGKKKRQSKRKMCVGLSCFVSHLLTHIHTLGTLWRQFPPGVFFYETFLVNE